MRLDKEVSRELIPEMPKTYIRPSKEHDTMSVASLLKFTAVTKSMCSDNVLTHFPAMWIGQAHNTEERISYLWQRSIFGHRRRSRPTRADLTPGCN